MFSKKGINISKENSFHGSHKVCTGLCMLEFIMDFHSNYLNIHRISLVPFRILTYLLLTYLLTYLLNYLLHEAVLLEKLPGSKLVKKFLGLYGTRSSLPYLQVPATCPYPQPDQPISSHLNPLPENPS